MITAAGRKALDEARIQQAVEDPRQLELPWEGRSPRAMIQEGLDRRIEAVRFSHAATPLDEDQMLDEQYRRFTHGW